MSRPIENIFYLRSAKELDFSVKAAARFKIASSISSPAYSGAFKGSSAAV